MGKGRIFVHGRHENSGPNYRMLKWTDVSVHFVHNPWEWNCFAPTPGRARIRSFGWAGWPQNRETVRMVQDLGDSEQVLRNRGLLVESPSQEE